MVLVAILFAFFRYSRMGLAMRAVAFDQEVALAQGVSVGFVFALVVGDRRCTRNRRGGVRIHRRRSRPAVVDHRAEALPVIILGGLDSLGGAVIAGLAIACRVARCHLRRGHCALAWR